MCLLYCTSIDKSITKPCSLSMIFLWLLNKSGDGYLIPSLGSLFQSLTRQRHFSKLDLAWSSPRAGSFGPTACYMGGETNRHFTTSSFHGWNRAVGSPLLPFLQADQHSLHLLRTKLCCGSLTPHTHSTDSY